MTKTGTRDWGLGTSRFRLVAAGSGGEALSSFRISLRRLKSATTTLPVIITTLCFLASAYAGNSKVGTTGAQFLKIAGGARPSGMGGAFVGLADDVNAITYNSAGLAGLEKPEFTFMHTQWFQDTSYEYGAFAWPASWGAIGINIATLQSDNIEKRSADTVTADSKFDSKDAVYKIGYGKNFNRFSAGANIGIVNQKLDTESASVFTADIGFLMRMEKQPLSLGLSLRNLGGKVKFKSEGDPLPLNITLGANYLLLSKLSLGLDLIKYSDSGMKFAAGTEYNHKFSSNIKAALRAGYNSQGTDPDGLTGLAVGAGLTYQATAFDFAWVPYGDLGNTFRYSLHINF